MAKKIRIKVSDISKPSDRLTTVAKEGMTPLPEPLRPEDIPDWKPLKDETKGTAEATLDDTLALGIPRPKSKQEEEDLVNKFLNGLRKLFRREDNWTFLQPLLLSMEHCAKCQTCSSACHIFEASGENEVYRPAYRSEALRRIYHKYIKPGGRLLSRWQHGDIDLNWTTVARLAELAYRCNICRRCAQTCPIGVDNALITHELRKLFSQEMGIAPKELHEKGSMLQLKVGSSTGMHAMVVKDNVEFIDEDTSERTGLEIKTPWDKEGAEVLLIHNAGEILAWPENHGAFAAIFQLAGVDWTLSSEIAGYDSINYGVWYDDVQLARVAIKHAEAARKLGVKKIVVGECGHAHKALMTIADRVLTGDLNIPRESCMTFLRDILRSGKIKIDKSRNDFPVALHDPCNMVRLMGIVDPQREILRAILAQPLRELSPCGVRNYCCGGGSGFAIMSPYNFADWRHQVAGRKKLQQVLEAFSDVLTPEIHKYLCAPCSNCKGQLRDIFQYYDIWERCGILYGGLVELVVNAMTDVKPGYIEWEWR
ncbi:MAG: (Fe-S)-binding protein [Planctomycetota bacterium]